MLLAFLDKKSRRDDDDPPTGPAYARDPLVDPTDESGRWSPSGKLRVIPGKTVAPVDHRPDRVVRADVKKDNVRLDSLRDLLTVGQVLGLRAIGVEYSRQIDQLTVAQMNEIGLNIGHIHQIQMATHTSTTTAGNEPVSVAAAAAETPVESFVDRVRAGDEDESSSSSYKMNG